MSERLVAVRGTIRKCALGWNVDIDIEREGIDMGIPPGNPPGTPHYHLPNSHTGNEFGPSWTWTQAGCERIVNRVRRRELRRDKRESDVRIFEAAP